MENVQYLCLTLVTTPAACNCACFREIGRRSTRYDGLSRGRFKLVRCLLWTAPFSLKALCSMTFTSSVPSMSHLPVPLTPLLSSCTLPPQHHIRHKPRLRESEAHMGLPSSLFTPTRPCLLGLERNLGCGHQFNSVLGDDCAHFEARLTWRSVRTLVHPDRDILTLHYMLLPLSIRLLRALACTDASRSRALTC